MPYQPGNRSQPSSGKQKGGNPQGQHNLNSLLDPLSQNLGPSPHQLKTPAPQAQALMKLLQEGK